MTEKFETLRKSYYHATTLVLFIFWFIVLFNEDYLFALALSFALWLLGTSFYMGYRSWKVFREDKKLLYLFICLLSYLLSSLIVYDIVTTTYELLTKIL